MRVLAVLGALCSVSLISGCGKNSSGQSGKHAVGSQSDLSDPGSSNRARRVRDALQTCRSGDGSTSAARGYSQCLSGKGVTEADIEWYSEQSGGGQAALGARRSLDADAVEACSSARSDPDLYSRCLAMERRVNRR